MNITTLSFFLWTLSRHSHRPGGWSATSNYSPTARQTSHFYVFLLLGEQLQTSFHATFAICLAWTGWTGQTRGFEQHLFNQFHQSNSSNQSPADLGIHIFEQSLGLCEDSVVCDRSKKQWNETTAECLMMEFKRSLNRVYCFIAQISSLNVKFRYYFLTKKVISHSCLSLVVPVFLPV